MANGTFTIQIKTENTQFRFTNGVLAVHGNYIRNLLTGEVTSLNGQAYIYDAEKESQNFEGDYLCQFNGNIDNGKLRYTLSALQRNDSDKAWDAIDEIEAAVLTNGDANGNGNANAEEE